MDSFDLDLESVDHALSTTRSVRRRLDFEREVEPEILEACIDIATQAPTGGQREGWRFLVVTDSAKKVALADLYRRGLEQYRSAAEMTSGERPPLRPTQQALADRLHQVPVLILVCIEGRPQPDNVAQQVAFYGSVLPAAWSLMVALRARGLGSTWTTLHLLHEAEAARLLQIPPEVTQTVLIPVGYMQGAVLRRAERKPAREVTYWNRWGDHGPDRA